jgi:hypothetical protein
MIFLWNPTHEDLDYTYGGLSYTLKAKTRKKVKEPEGNHALNALGSRGLTKLVFDDDGKSIDEDKIEADAIERNKEFRIRQINTYNYRNETRKASGQPYDVPTKEVKRYAAELGIALLQPYSMVEGEKAVVAQLSKDNEDKDRQLKEQGDAIAKLTEMVNKLSEQMIGGISTAKPTDLVKCDVCGELVMAKMMKSHMNYKHKDK